MPARSPWARKWGTSRSTQASATGTAPTAVPMSNTASSSCRLEVRGRHQGSLTPAPYLTTKPPSPEPFFCRKVKSSPWAPAPSKGKHHQRTSPVAGGAASSTRASPALRMAASTPAFSASGSQLRRRTKRRRSWARSPRQDQGSVAGSPTFRTGKARLSLSRERPGDHHPVHLGGTLSDPAGPQLAVPPLEREVFGEAHAPVDLDGPVYDLCGDLGRHQLGHG